MITAGRDHPAHSDDSGPHVLALLYLLVLIAFFLTVARVAAVTLEVTGMPRHSAEFQARSALLGVGFTTLESEEITNHPVRRRIVLWLMTMGNAGVITGIGSFILAFGHNEAVQTLQRSGELVAGIALLLVSVHIPAANRVITNVTRAYLRRFTRLELSDVVILLGLPDDHAVAEVRARRGDWLTGRTLGELGLDAGQVAVLGLRRHDGAYLEAPAPTTAVRSGDALLVHGRTPTLRALAHQTGPGRAGHPGGGGRRLDPRALGAVRRGPQPPARPDHPNHEHVALEHLAHSHGAHGHAGHANPQPPPLV